MNFSQALDLIINHGFKMRRSGWNGKGMYIKAQFPDSNSQNTLPYIWIFTADKNRVPWICSQTDMFAQDWEISE